MIEPNRLSAPGERAALERVEVIVERIDRIPFPPMVPSRATTLDPDTRDQLLAEVGAEAARIGRAALLDDVCTRVADAMTARFAQPLVRYSVNPVRSDDEAVLISAVVDAVAVAVMEDRIAPETAARLSRPGRLALGLPLLDPADAPGPQAPEPSAADWTAAASGDTRIDGYSPVPMGARRAFAIITAVVLAPLAVFAGVAVGQTGAGVLAGLAVVAVCWLVATYRR